MSGRRHALVIMTANHSSPAVAAVDQSQTSDRMTLIGRCRDGLSRALRVGSAASTECSPGVAESVFIAYLFWMRCAHACVEIPDDQKVLILDDVDEWVRAGCADFDRAGRRSDEDAT